MDNEVKPKSLYGLLILGEILKFTILALLIVVPFRFFVAQPFIVSGASMTPTIHSSEYLVIDLATYHLDEPERGDVVIFKFPFDTSVYFIKRIIGLPGETVSIQNGVVTITTIDGDMMTLNEPYIADENRSHESTRTTVLEDNEYFVLGDNRSGSSDSRVWGPLNKKFIVGRALLRLYPLDTLDYLPGQYTFTGN